MVPTPEVNLPLQIGRKHLPALIYAAGIVVIDAPICGHGRVDIACSAIEERHWAAVAVSELPRLHK